MYIFFKLFIETEEAEVKVEKCDFDPRHPSEQAPLQSNTATMAVQGLMDVFAGSGLGQAWGLSAKPPCPSMEVEVQTSIKYSKLKLYSHAK